MTESTSAKQISGVPGQNAGKPHLLLLAYAFPPSRAVGGLRAWFIAKHLSQLGWRVTVVTPDPALIEGAGDPQSTEEDLRAFGINRILTGHRLAFLMEGYIRGGRWIRSLPVRGLARLVWSRFGVPRELGWKRSVIDSCAGLEPGDVDVVFATAPPHYAFAIAASLARRLGARLVFDYRDLWVDNPHGRFHRSWIRKRRERRALTQASGITVASPTMLEILEPKLPKAAPGVTLMNGFDPSDFSGLPAAKFEEFAVVYAGSLYPPKNSLAPVLRAIRIANESLPPGSPRLRLHYYGPAAAEVEAEARGVGGIEDVRLHGVVPRPDVIGALKGATAVVVITTILPSQSREERTIVTSKVFEGIGAGARILMIAPPESDARRVLERYGCGSAFSGDEIDRIARWLRGVAGKAPNPDERAAESFAWPSTVVDLDRFLRLVVAGRQASAGVGWADASGERV